MMAGVELLEIGSRLEPFVDDYWSDSIEGAQLRLQAEVLLRIHGNGYIIVLKGGGTFQVTHRAIVLK